VRGAKKEQMRVRTEGRGEYTREVFCAPSPMAIKRKPPLAIYYGKKISVHIAKGARMNYGILIVLLLILLFVGSVLREYPAARTWRAWNPLREHVGFQPPTTAGSFSSGRSLGGRNTASNLATKQSYLFTAYP